MNVSVVPERKIRDPRQLLYHFPKMNIYVFAQKTAQYYHDQTVKTIEKMAWNLGYILIPSPCLHWKIKAKIDESRKVQVGKEVYYLMLPEEITDRTHEKFLSYVGDRE